MDDFEKWYSVYRKTISSLQKQKVSSAKTRISQYSEELLKAEKSKSKTIDGLSVEMIIADSGIKIRKAEDLCRRSKKILDSMEEESFTGILSRLEKHSLFDGIIPDPETGELSLYTKNLKEGKNSIGRFRIVLKNNEHLFIRAINIDYQQGYYDHWAIKEFRPCFGQWADDITRVTNEGDIYSIFDTMCIYIMTSGDGSAYMRKPQWYDERTKLPKEASEKKEFARLKNLNGSGSLNIGTEMETTLMTMMKKMNTTSKYALPIMRYHLINSIDPSVLSSYPSVIQELLS